MTELDGPERREPAFNLPGAVTVLILAMGLLHAVRGSLLSPRQDAELLLIFSFIPVRYEAVAAGYDFPGGVWAEVWSPVTYALLHGDWVHFGVNAVWLAAFGSALAWRFGTARFLVFSALGAVAGAGAHWIGHADEMVPMVGASGAISAHMAAVARFMFQSGGPFRGGRRDPSAFRAPALPLGRALADRRVLGFLGVWLALNLAFGLGGLAIPGEEEASIAWEAHVGGFLFGLLAFAAFDPVRRGLPASPPMA
jgi:membrane associated rhomboid family serine protease